MACNDVESLSARDPLQRVPGAGERVDLVRLRERPAYRAADGGLVVDDEGIRVDEDWR